MNIMNILRTLFSLNQKLALGAALSFVAFASSLSQASCVEASPINQGGPVLKCQASAVSGQTNSICIETGTNRFVNRGEMRIFPEGISSYDLETFFHAPLLLGKFGCKTSLSDCGHEEYSITPAGIRGYSYRKQGFGGASTESAFELDFGRMSGKFSKIKQNTSGAITDRVELALVNCQVEKQ